MGKRVSAGSSLKTGLLVATLLSGVTPPVGIASAIGDEEISIWDLEHLGPQYLRLGMFRESAEAYERFADRLIAEDTGRRSDEDIGDALTMAARLRMALGESAEAARDVERLDEAIGRPRKPAPHYWDHNEEASAYPTRAAEMLIELGSHYAERKDLAWQARYWERTLRAYSVQHSLAHRIRAEVKLAQVRWKQSCPVPGKDGLCVDRIPLWKSPPKWDFCDAGWMKLEQPRVQERNAALVAAALSGTRRALASYPVQLVLSHRRSGETRFRLGDAALTEAVEDALLIQADHRYERFLAAAPSPALSTGTASEIKQRFHSWHMLRKARLDALWPAYRDLMDLSDGDAGSVAAARLAQSAHLLWAGTMMAPQNMPRVPKGPPGLSKEEWKKIFHGGYCMSRESDYAPPVITERYSMCLERNARLGLSNEWSAQCERGAHMIDPSEWPHDSEIYSTEADIAFRGERALPSSGAPADDAAHPHR